MIEDYDGMIGFSQGGILTVVLAALIEDPNRALSINVDPFLIQNLKYKFSLSFSPFLIRDERCQPWFTKPINFPICLVYGTSDELVSPELTKALGEHFVNSVLIEHDGGHYVPTNGDFKNKYLNFLEQFQSND
jgi:predicted esterase